MFFTWKEDKKLAKIILKFIDYKIYTHVLVV